LCFFGFFVSHTGQTADAGHFTAVVHDAASEQWLRYDDNRPVAIVEEIMISTATHTSPNVCLALYARVPDMCPIWYRKLGEESVKMIHLGQSDP